MPFFVAKYVAKGELGAYEMSVLNPALSDKYKNDNKLTGGVYRYDSSWDSNKTTRKLNTNENVNITNLKNDKQSVSIQEWKVPDETEAEDITNKLNAFEFYELAYHENGAVQWPGQPDKTVSKDQLSIDNTNISVNGFARINLGTEQKPEWVCSALELPVCKSGSGYHYNVSKISAVEWNSEYGRTLPPDKPGEKPTLNINNVSTGIKPLEGDYSNLVDTIFVYKQKEENATKYLYEAQANIGLIIEEKANTYTINFDANGGEGTMDSITKMYDATDNKLPKNSFTKTGYTFAGWMITQATYPDTIYQYPKYEDYPDPNEKTEKLIKDNLKSINVYIADESYRKNYVDKDEYIPSNHNETVTMTAQWKANTYTVNFNANGGTGDMAPQTLTYDKEGSLSENAFTKSGYKFAGWNTEADGTGTRYDDGQKVKNLASEKDAKVTLYAQWTANTYTVNFDANTGTGSMDFQEFTYDDEPKALNANKFTKTGYAFTGWNDEADGTGEHNYSNQEKVRNLASEKDAEVTLYAQWKANDYTVKFDTDGGSAIADKTVNWEDNVLANVEDPTKDGFTFKGWKCGEAEVTAETTYSALAEDDAIEELTLTAQWEEVVVPPVDEPTTPEETPTPDDTSSTGDNMNITLLMALLLLSGCGIAGAGLYRRNHVK